MADKAILVVDDELGMLELLRIFFERAKYRVLMAENGDAALDLAEHYLPDAIILDFMLPDISGGDVCRILKDNPLTQHIPVIMHSANPRIIDKPYLAQIGADEAVIKPCDVRKLLTIVEGHINSAQV
jgi:two-component system alkaline phosphatase synthesis response regulator PhoP